MWPTWLSSLKQDEGDAGWILLPYDAVGTARTRPVSRGKEERWNPWMRKRPALRSASPHTRTLIRSMSGVLDDAHQHSPSGETSRLPPADTRGDASGLGQKWSSGRWTPTAGAQRAAGDAAGGEMRKTDEGTQLQPFVGIDVADLCGSTRTAFGKRPYPWPRFATRKGESGGSRSRRRNR